MVRLMVVRGSYWVVRLVDRRSIGGDRSGSR